MCLYTLADNKQTMFTKTALHKVVAAKICNELQRMWFDNGCRHGVSYLIVKNETFEVPAEIDMEMYKLCLYESAKHFKVSNEVTDCLETNGYTFGSDFVFTFEKQESKSTYSSNHSNNLNDSSNSDENDHFSHHNQPDVDLNGGKYVGDLYVTFEPRFD